MVENFLTVVIGDGFRRLDDRFGPLQTEPVVIEGGTLKSVPNGTGANDDGFDAGSETELGDKLGSVLGMGLGTGLGTALGSELGPPLGTVLGSELGTPLGTTLGKDILDQN